MKRILLLLVPAVLTAALVACSYGPRFDAGVAPTPEDTALLLKQERLRVSPLDSNLFETVTLTNVMDPAWLKPPTNFYRLGPSDIIEIEALGEPDSRVQAMVGPDGRVYYGLLPGLSVWGLTLSEARQLIEKEMAKFLRAQPEITVSLRTNSNQRVWILGSVQQPGVYSMAGPMTVLEAVTAAGGTVPEPGMNAGIPNLDYSFILRDGKVIRLDFARLLRNGDLSQNIYLQPDDFVYLRPGMLRNVYVMGAVRTPAALPYRDGMSLATVIAATGSTVEYAQRFKIVLVRGSLSSPRVALINFSDIIKGKAADVLLEPGDIVYIPLVPWEKLGRLVEQLAGTFVRTIAINEGYRAVYPNAAPLRPGVGYAY